MKNNIVKYNGHESQLGFLRLCGPGGYRINPLGTKTANKNQWRCGMCLK